MASAARGACQSRPVHALAARYNQTQLPFLPTRPTSRLGRRLSSLHTRSLQSFFCPHPNYSPFSSSRSPCASPVQLPRRLFAIYPLAQHYHEETYRRIPSHPHPAAFSVTCTPTLPLRPLQINSPFFLETKAGLPDFDVDCAYRQIRVTRLTQSPRTVQFA
jgi:hypothetical protein